MVFFLYGLLRPSPPSSLSCTEQPWCRELWSSEVAEMWRKYADCTLPEIEVAMLYWARLLYITLDDCGDICGEDALRSWKCIRSERSFPRLHPVSNCLSWGWNTWQCYCWYSWCLPDCGVPMRSAHAEITVQCMACVVVTVWWQPWFSMTSDMQWSSGSVN